MIQKTKGGFVALPVIIFLAVIAIGIGVYFWMNNSTNTNTTSNTNTTVTNHTSNTNTATNVNTASTNGNTNSVTNTPVTSKSYTSTKYHFTFSYPTTWTKQTLPTSGLSGVEQVGFTPTSVLSAYTTKYGHDQFWLSSFKVFVTNQTPKAWYKDNLGQPTSASESAIHGYTAYYGKVVNSYRTDHGYAVSHNGILLFATFREKDASFNSNGTLKEQQSYTQYLSAFQDMVKSIEFTN